MSWLRGAGARRAADGSPTCTWSGPCLSEAHLEEADLRGRTWSGRPHRGAPGASASPGRTWSGPTSPRRTWRSPMGGEVRTRRGAPGGARLVGAHLERAYLGAAHLERSRPRRGAPGGGRPELQPGWTRPPRPQRRRLDRRLPRSDHLRQCQPHRREYGAASATLPATSGARIRQRCSRRHAEGPRDSPH